MLLCWLALAPWIRWRTTHYVFTTHRVLIRRGVFRHTGRDISLQRINDVGFTQSLWDRIVGAGTLTIESAGEHGQETLENIPHSDQQQQTLNRLIEQDGERRARLAYGGGYPQQGYQQQGYPQQGYPQQNYPQPELPAAGSTDRSVPAELSPARPHFSPVLVNRDASTLGSAFHFCVRTAVARRHDDLVVLPDVAVGGRVRERGSDPALSMIVYTCAYGSEAPLGVSSSGTR